MLPGYSKAWKILTDEERTALSLQFSFDKSTWQAGEIMGKAHYKYLEIKARAERFLKMFTEYYSMYDQNLFPETLDLDETFKKYLTLTIEKRHTPHQAILKIKGISSSSGRDILINKVFTELQKKEDFDASALLNLILDFDRWNNYRILPRDLQEPSAFKRRNKNRLKKQLKNVTNLNLLVIEKIEEWFTDETPIKIHHPYRGWLTLMIHNESKLVPINIAKDKHLAQINRLGLFIFKDLEKAQNFATLVSSFNTTQPKNCKEGLEFWPKYRILIKSAINYTEIENIIPSRKYLENAMRDMDEIMSGHKKTH